MSRSRLLLATVAAYLPAGALAPLADDAPGGPLDPATLVVPFCLGFAVGFPAWGRLTDRWTPAVVVRGAVLAAAAASLLVAVAPSEGVLVLARALQGLAAAGVPPAVQAALAADSTEARTGRALSPMMLAVAVAVFVGPALAPLLGWTVTTLTLAGLLLLTGLAPIRAAARPRGRAARGRYENARGVHAGWIVSACVLAGHWTVLTRLVEAPGDESVAALTGVAGLPLVVLAARASDVIGPRRTMTATLVAGAAGFGLAAGASDAILFTLAAGVGLAVYWAYLPVVAAQVQRSAGEFARGRAAGGLYASMWGSAAAAGALASLAPGWREEFLGASAPWRKRAPQPSPR